MLRGLVENHRRFLAFLERRVASREEAEDILQDGFARALERAETVREEESAVAWFYRLLRNALVDRHRRRAAEARALERVAGMAQEDEPPPDEELRAAVCGCVSDLLGTLKTEYATAIRRVDLDGATPASFARETGITVNNAGVRVHRAREALRRQLVRACGTCVEHGCLDCVCGRPTLKRGRNLLAR
ncbi:MAG: RNA polymerase sigma factor [Gemmatimonadales bacterium]